MMGATDILVIAPHGPVINGSYQNDIRTGIIAEELHKELGCSAIINDRFFKPKGSIKKDAAKYFLDLFRIDHARKVPGYLEQIKEIVQSDGVAAVYDIALKAGNDGPNHGWTARLWTATASKTLGNAGLTPGHCGAGGSVFIVGDGEHIVRRSKTLNGTSWLDEETFRKGDLIWIEKLVSGGTATWTITD